MMKETDLLTFKRITIMKKQYILPSTTIVPCYASLICQTASPASGFSIGGNSNLGIGGETTTIEPM